MKKNLIKEQQKFNNKIEKDSSQDSQELNDQLNELNFISKFKKNDAMFINYRGLIQYGQIHFADSLTVMYKIITNQNWKLSQGQDTGLSQNASLGGGKVVWNFAFQPTFQTKNPVGWPQLMVVLYGKDYFGRSVVKGYGNIHLPSGQGNHIRKIRIFQTIPKSNIANCCAFILGYINQLKLPEKVLLGEQQCRQILRVKSIGQVTIKVQVRRYNFENYGYQ